MELDSHLTFCYAANNVLHSFPQCGFIFLQQRSRYMYEIMLCDCNENCQREFSGVQFFVFLEENKSSISGELVRYFTILSFVSLSPAAFRSPVML